MIWHTNKQTEISTWYIPSIRFLDPPPPPINFVHGSDKKFLNPESVLTNLTRGRSARPPSPS